jgi:hypothetical protein
MVAMAWFMEIVESVLPKPKRGDLIQTNIGSRRERTWIILRSRRMTRAKNRRYALWKARWWELEPKMRNELFRSAERNGGQITWACRPLKPAPRRKNDFESLLAKGLEKDLFCGWKYESQVCCMTQAQIDEYQRKRLTSKDNDRFDGILAMPESA